MEREKVSELDFGYMLLTHDSKGKNMFEAVTIAEFSDENGVFYVPITVDYCSSNEAYTGNDNGYITYEQALRCVGRCIDKAKSDVKKRI